MATARQLSAEAVAAEYALHIRKRRSDGSFARWQVMLQQFAIAPVMRAAGTQRTAAVAAPLVQDGRYAVFGQASANGW